MTPTLEEHVEEALDFERERYAGEYPGGCLDDFGDYIDEVRGNAAERWRELYTMDLAEQLEYSQQKYLGIR